MIAIAVVNVPFFARTVRGTTLGLGRRAFVEAARLGGAGPGRILLRELLPNVLPLVVIMMSTNLGWMILETAGLSFLGLGAQPPVADLGSMLGAGREFLTTVPRVAVLPGLVILFLVVGINLVGDGLRDLLDPRLKGESESRPAPRSSERAESRPSAGADALLRVEALSVHFVQNGATFRALDKVGLELGTHERVAVVGESGSGKTVLALSLLGLVPPPGRVVGGRILFRGEDLVRAPEARRRDLRGDRIAYVPQDPMAALNPSLTVGAQLVETLRAHRSVGRRRAREHATELLARVRLPEPERRVDAYPHELSGGMRQRVLIAMAMACEPRVLIADEPTTALDVTTQAQVLSQLTALAAAAGTAILLITHDLGLVAHYCDRALVMRSGRIVEDAPVSRLFSRPGHPYTAELLAAARREAS
jgi:peptide/nickel transport system permease protein